MNRNRWIRQAVLAIIVGLALGTLFKRRAPEETRHGVLNPPNASLKANPMVQWLAPPAATITTTETSAVEESIESLSPSTEDLRREVENNTHETPRSLAHLAEQMAPRIERAKATESEARKLIVELRACAQRTTTTSPVQVRTWCALNALDLKKRWPALKTPGDEFENNLAPDVRELLQKRQRIAR